MEIGVCFLAVVVGAAAFILWNIPSLIGNRPVKSICFTAIHIGEIKVEIPLADNFWKLLPQYTIYPRVTTDSMWHPQLNRYRVTVTAVPNFSDRKPQEISFFLTTEGTYRVIPQEDGSFHVYDPRDTQLQLL